MLPADLRRALGARLLTLLRERARAALEPRRRDLDALRAAAADLRAQQRAMLDDLDRRLAALDRRPLTAESTVHAAWRRPGAREIFAARGLPDCPSCAVGADETLAEAAGLEGLPLDELLRLLNRLPPPAP